MISIKRDVQSRDKVTGQLIWDGAKSCEEIYDFEDLLTEVQNCKREGLHEMLIGDTYRPYADVDRAVASDLSKADFDREEYNTLSAAHATMERLFPAGEVQFMSASSHKAGKISGHFVVNNIYYTTKAHIKYVLEHGCDMHALHMDTGVYTENHLMRLPLCSKPGQKRPLRAAEIFNVGDVQRIRYLGLDDETEMAYGLITHIGPDDERMPAPDGYVESDADRADANKCKIDRTTYNGPHLSMEQIAALLAAISDARVEDRSNRYVGVRGIRQLAEYQNVDLREMAHAWAKKASAIGKYDPAQVDKDYTKHEKKAYTFNTIIRWARYDGYKERAAEERRVPATYYDVADRVALLNRPGVGVEDVEDYHLGNLALIEDTETWYCRFRDGWKKLPGRASQPFPYATKSSAASITVPGKMVEDKKTKQLVQAPPAKLQFSEILQTLMTKPVFKQCAFRTEEYVPYFKSPPERIWNTFKGWVHPFTPEPMEDDADVACVLELLHDLCGREAAVFAYFKAWLANYVQRPMEKMPLILLYSRVQGVGKGILEDFLTSHVFGEDQVIGTTNPQIIVGHFNAAAAGHQLYVLQEMKAEGLHDIDTLKELTTGTRITRQKKGLEAEKAKNYGKFMIATNHPDVMKIEPSDRRCVMLDAYCEHAGDHAYYKRLTSRILNGTVGAKFLNYLAQYDLTGFNAQAIPMTRLKEDAKLRSMPSPLLHIKDLCEGKRPQWPDIRGAPRNICAKGLFADYQAWCTEEGIHGKMKAASYKEAIHRHLGFPAKPKQVMEEGVRQYVYRFDYDAIDAEFKKHLKSDTSLLEAPLVD